MSSRLLTYWICSVLLAAFTCKPVRAQIIPGTYTDQEQAYRTYADTAGLSLRISEIRSSRLYANDSVADILKEILSDSKHLGYIDGIKFSLSQLGDLYISQGEYDIALQYLRESLIILNPASYTIYELSDIYNDLGRALVWKGLYEESMLFFYRAARLFEDVHTPDGRDNLAGTYNNMGMALNHIQSEEAPGRQILYYLDQAEDIISKSTNINLVSTILANKGVLYLQQKQFDSSKLYLDSALQLSRSYQLHKLRYGILNNLGDLHNTLSQPAEALVYLHESIQVKGPINPYYRTATLASLGQSHLLLKNFDKANQYLQNALALAERFHLVTNQIQINEILASLYAETGSFQNAFAYYKARTRLKDSLAGEKVRMNMNVLDSRYKASQKDKAILQQQLLISDQKNRLAQQQKLVLIIFVTAIALAVTLVALFRNNRHRQHLQSEKIRNLKSEKEIAQLRALIQGEEKERVRLARELHDGIGSQLAAIKMHFNTVRKDHPELIRVVPLNDIVDMISNTAEDIRTTAHNLMPDILTRYGLSNALMLYCDQINKSGNLHADLQLYGDLDNLNESFTLMLYRMVQELIQNIIKHAHAKHAVIQIRKEDEIINIVVEDNGIGFTQSLPAEGPGIGLHQLASRIRMMHGEMLIDSGEGAGTVIYIRLNCSLFEKMHDYVYQSSDHG